MLIIIGLGDSSDSKAFLYFIAFSGSPTGVHCALLFFDAKASQVY